MIFKAIKILFIFIRHGINPFLSVEKNKEKMKRRFSEKEKQWIIDIAKGYAKEYLEKMFVGD